MLLKKKLIFEGINLQSAYQTKEFIVSKLKKSILKNGKP